MSTIRLGGTVAAGELDEPVRLASTGLRCYCDADVVSAAEVEQTFFA